MTTLKRGMKGAGVRHMQRMLVALGYDVLADGDFGPETEAAVRRFQRSRMLDDDGIVGTSTWERLEIAAAMKPIDADLLTAAGEIAAGEAERLWRLDIVDPPSRATAWQLHREHIDRFIRSPLGLGWSWDKPYEMVGTGRQWCLAFVMACWSRAGLGLKPHRYSFGSSTFRVDQWARYGSFEGVSAGKPPTGVKPRMIIELDEFSTAADCVFPDGTAPRAGDIVLVGDGMPKYGDHGTIAAAYDPITGVFDTFEGNATGAGPRGNRRHGVIKARRAVGGRGYAVRRVVRPSIADLEA